MRYVDEQYYCEEFQGEPVISAGFPALCAMAEKIVEELTLYRLSEESFASMPENSQKLVKDAVCAEIEYLDANGGADIDNGNQASSASLGKFSYSGISAGNGSTERSVFSPRAERILWPTGLTFRGGGCL